MVNTYFSCFCAIRPLVINGSTSPLGELTTKTITYAKEPDYYYQDNKSCYLISFRGVKGNSQFEKIPSTHKDLVMNVCNWLYERAVENKFSSSNINCLQQLKAEFIDGYNFIKVNTMVTNSSIWLPSSIQFTVTKNNVEHEFKIWFANEYFQEEFPYVDFYVFGPVPPEEIDLLVTLDYKRLRERLNEETAARLEERVHKLLDNEKYPYTSRTVVSYDVYDLINKDHKTEADWTIIAYGNTKDSDDAKEEAIKDCIKDHTKKDDGVWEEAIPDLWNPTEIFLIPYFNKIGRSNETLKGSTYSPMYKPISDDSLPKKYFDFFDQSFILNNLEIVPHLYKSVIMAAIGKPKNSLNRTTFSSIYGDYQLLPSLDPEAGVMSKETTEFNLRVEEMLAVAETVDPNTPSTGKISKVIRKDRLYISLKIGKIKTTMLTRYQLVNDGVIIDE